jgi:predicted flavoprotein YhiN
MPSVGRKFLMAGKGGMNLTHSEPADAFLARYGARSPHIAPLLARFDAGALRNWVHELGVETFVGSSGRVFPTDMKAAPMLRAWLHRLRATGVTFHMRHRWLGFADEGTSLSRFATPTGEKRVRHQALVLALGGASWPQLGSDGRALRGARRAGAAFRAVELRFRRRLERAFQQPIRWRAAQVRGDRPAASGRHARLARR